VDELVNLVTQRTGLSAQQAQTAIQTVLGFLKDRLPAPIAGEVDRLIGSSTGGSTGASSGSSSALGNLGEVESVAKGLGGMLGKQP
jgi:hypothetical protein